ncbi:MAG: Grx4 family monothiol glutaredoxin [Hyphomicrobiales bacterium]|nr:Grx4 family monothiol glutaredoxin [Hyphomicrobiales bacterium]
MNAKHEEIQKVIDENDVVLFVKGTAKFPQCGFSAVVIQIFDRLGVQYKDVNILEDNDLRQELKVFSDWPTFPQIYLKGELIGGCDIAREMFTSGELQEALKEKGIPFSMADAS